MILTEMWWYHHHFCHCKWCSSLELLVWVFIRIRTDFHYQGAEKKQNWIPWFIAAWQQSHIFIMKGLPMYKHSTLVLQKIYIINRSTCLEAYSSSPEQSMWNPVNFILLPGTQCSHYFLVLKLSTNKIYPIGLKIYKHNFIQLM
jgi:hypothetical protein